MSITLYVAPVLQIREFVTNCDKFHCTVGKYNSSITFIVFVFLFFVLLESFLLPVIANAYQ